MPHPRPGHPPRVLGPMSLALAAAALVFHLAPYPWPTNRFDTGIHLAAAGLIRDGAQPYADFQTLYTPGSYYLLAGAWEVFGATFDVHSILDFVLLAANAWVAWRVAVIAGAPRFAALAAFGAGLAFTYPYPSLLLAFAAIVVASSDRPARVMARAACAGAVAGLGGWFRQDFGAIGACAAAVAVAMSVPGATWRARAAAAAVVAGSSALVLGTLLLPAIVVAPRALWDGLVVNPLATVPFRDSTHALGDALRDPAFALPVLVAIAAIPVAIFCSARAARSGNARRAAAFAGLTVLAAWCVRYVALRAETHHLVPAGIVGAVVLAAASGVATRRATALIAMAAAAAAVALPLARTSLARAAHVSGRRAASSPQVPADVLAGASTLHFAPGEAEPWFALVRHLRSTLRNGETFLSACSRHDAILTQDLLLYFAADRLPPVRDYHFDPGVTTREDVQRRIVAESEEAGVRVIVRFAPSGVNALPAGAGARTLDDWIAERFEAGPRFGRYEVWTRR